MKRERKKPEETFIERTRKELENEKITLGKQAYELGRIRGRKETIDKACGAYCLVCKERDTDCFEYCKGLPGKAECNAITDFRKAMEE